MTPLGDRLAAKIRAHGPITVFDYMQACLGDPEHGYYTTRDPLGRGGDFTTAPEISQMFGELIGLWCAERWRAMGGPGAFILCELGPGRGTLMADALRAAKGVPGFVDAARLHLVERSPALAARQRDALAAAGLATPPAWTGELAEVAEGPLILIANEFLDALPIRQFVRAAGGWHERTVVLDAAGGGFRFGIAANPTSPAPVPAAVASRAAAGDLFETSPLAQDCLAEVGRRLAAAPGAALFVDYGHPLSAAGETLQAVRDHAYAGVLDEPGEADLTAHVDFQAMAAAASASGAAVFGPVEQGTFLDRLGLGARAAMLLGRATPAQAAEIASARHRLTAADGMGRLFKALAVQHPALGGPAGFTSTSWA